MSNKRAGLVWVDAQGEQVLHVVNTATGIGAIESAIAAESNAGLIECWEGLLEQFSPTPTVATYPTVRTVAVLLFKDAIGSTARLYVPSPKASLFDSTGDTVDPAAAAGIISAALGNLVSGAGQTVSIFEGGFLSKTNVRALESTDVVQFINPFTGKGQLIYSTDSAGDYAALVAGPTGDVLQMQSSGLPAWEPVSGITPTLPLVTNVLGADVSIPTANTYVTGPSVSLTAGTWLIIGNVAINTTAVGGGVTVRLTDGTTNYASAAADYGLNGDSEESVSAIVVLSGAATLSVQVAVTVATASKIAAAARFNAAGNTASYLLAVKVAP
jgi:hypothetical protein